MKLPSYPKIKYQGRLQGQVYVQEKLDGSQISFGLVDGKLQVRSKNTALDRDWETS